MPHFPFLRATLLASRSLHASPRLALASASAASARPLPLLARRPLCSAPAPEPAPALAPPAQQNEPRTLSELPPKWRKLTYQELEVFDTSGLRSLQSLLEQERVRVTEQRAIAKEQQRKVLRVECDLDLKRIAKIEMWLNVIFNDKRRTW